MTYSVLLTREAQHDLERLFDFVLQRELARAGGDLELAEEALAEVKAGLKALERFPFTCRKATDSPFLRELIIPFGSTGYVAHTCDRGNRMGTRGRRVAPTRSA